MLEQIQELVRKSLPAEVGDQLRKYMIDAQTWESNVKRLTREAEDQEKRLAGASAKVAELEAKLKLAGELDARQKDISHRENRLAVTLAQNCAQEAEKRAQGIFDLAAMAFRNPTFKRSEYNTVPIPSGQFGTTLGSESKSIEEKME